MFEILKRLKNTLGL